MKYLRYLVLMFIMGCVGSAWAYQTPPVPQASSIQSTEFHGSKVSIPSGDAHSVDPGRSEITLLRAQNEIIKSYQESILNTVYWALGGVFALAILLAGFGWWSNFKLNEIDKDRLRSEMRLELEKLSSETGLVLEQSAADVLRSVRERNDAHTASLDKMTERMTENLSSFRGEIDEKTKETSQSLLALVEGMGLATKRIHRTEATLRQVEELIWDIKGIQMNVLLTQCQGVYSSISAGDVDLLKNILARMLATAQTLIDAGTIINSDLMVTIKKCVSSAAEMAPIEAASVSDALANVVAG